MADRLRIAVIGAGVMGRNHMRVYNELADVELVAIADLREEVLVESPVRAYQDYRRLLEEETLDAVSIAVPARVHHDVALACIERGIATLVEKPLAATLAEGSALRDAAEANSTPLMVGHIERFNPAVRELKQRLEGGALGRIFEARTRRVGPFFQRERDIGAAHDLATHDIDVLFLLLEHGVVQVRAETQCNVRTEFEDSVTALLRFENGTIAQIEANWLTPVKQRELTLVGERGMYVLDYISQSLTYYPQAGSAEGAAEPVVVPGAGAEPLRAEVAAFVRVARRLEAPPVSASDGIASLRVADAIVESGRTGEPVRLVQAGPAR